MKINRLFEMLYLIMDRENMTAAELAEHFEVSVRTVYRDVDVLSGAGIPIYARKGKGGGIRLLPGFVLNKSLLTGEEKNDILAALQTFSAARVPDADSMLEKLGTFFNQNVPDWIEVDFAEWGTENRNRFNLLREALLSGRVIAFDYYNSAGQKARREVEPVQLWFKHRSWYLKAWCLARDGPRLFKLGRMRNLHLTDRPIRPRTDPFPKISADEHDAPRIIHLVLQIEAALAWRVYDEFDETQIRRQPDGNFLVTADLIEDEWFYNYLLSFGPHLRILQPNEVKSAVRRRIEKLLQNYL